MILVPFAPLWLETNHNMHADANRHLIIVKEVNELSPAYTFAD